MSTMTLVVMFGDDVGHDTKHVIHDIVSSYNNKFHEERSLGLLGYC